MKNTKTYKQEDKSSSLLLHPITILTVGAIDFLMLYTSLFLPQYTSLKTILHQLPPTNLFRVLAFGFEFSILYGIILIFIKPKKPHSTLRTIFIILSFFSILLLFIGCLLFILYQLGYIHGTLPSGMPTFRRGIMEFN